MGTNFKWIRTFELVFICCSLVSLSISYDIGQTYNYEYSTNVHVNEVDAGSRDVSFQVDAQVSATNVWQNPVNNKEYLLLLKVTSPALLLVPKGGNENAELKSHQSALDKYKDSVIVAHLDDGSIVDLYADNDESQFLDLKSGIASLFQLNTKISKREESDSSGKCKVFYEVKGNSVTKYKKDCQSAFVESTKVPPLPILRGNLKSVIESRYELTRENVISTVLSEETQTFQAVLVKSAGATIKSQQKLNLVGQNDGSKILIRKQTLKDAIKSLAKSVGTLLKKVEFHLKNVTANAQQCKNFIDVLNKRRSSFQTKNLGKFNSVSTFLDILQYSSDCSQESVTNLLKSPKNKEIIPQLLDVFAATETVASINGALDFLKLDAATQDIDLVERFLSSLAGTSYPHSSIIEKLVAILEKNPKNPKLSETLLLTVGNLVKKYQANRVQNNEVVERVLKFITNKIKECKEYTCQLPYLRALKQAGLPGSMPTLLEVIRVGGKSVPEAILTLQSLPKHTLTEEVKYALIEVYFQLRIQHHSSARILAAEVLLSSNPSVELIREILLTFNKTVSEEMATYVLSKANDLASRDNDFKKKFETALRIPKLNNYHILAKSGFSVTEVHEVPDFKSINGSYTIKAEFLQGGVFKRSVLDTALGAGEHDPLDVFSFGTFAGGLASFSSSGNADNSEDEEDLTAGVQLNLLGTAVRPYTFFTGQGEAMSLLWSGAGSETTPIFQTIMKLQDGKNVISLQNGLKVEFLLTGASSVDLSGSAQVSIWSRTSQSLVTNSIALLMRSLTRIDASFIDAKVEVTTASDLALEFITDSDFSDKPLKSCMLFQHNPFLIKQLVSKVERVPGSGRKLRRSVRKKYTIQGRCLALNRRVCDMCSLMNTS